MIILGLGTNKGDRLGNLRKAVELLSGVVKDIQCSPIYESPALLPNEAPPEWDIDFLNMAISAKTDISPRELLTTVKNIEKKIGRTPTGHWGPREIDIDILGFNDVILEIDNLVIPHKYLLVRDFALIPFADIAPDWKYPLKGQFKGMTAKALARNLVSSLKKTKLVI